MIESKYGELDLIALFETAKIVIFSYPTTVNTDMIRSYLDLFKTGQRAWNFISLIFTLVFNILNHVGSF